MNNIEFHPEAQTELEKASNWYRERTDLPARAFTKEVVKELKRIAESPESWPQTRANERRFLFRRFPYSIIYRVREDEVFITAIAHQRRRPGYWERRS